MDDLVGWSNSIDKMQNQISFLQDRLNFLGLRVNLEKSSTIVFGEVGGDRIKAQGSVLKAQPPGTPLMVMGLPVGPRVTGADFLEALFDKVRKSFRANWSILHSRAKIGDRLRVLDRVCFGILSWIISALRPTVANLKMLNQLHMELLVSMLGWVI